VDLAVVLLVREPLFMILSDVQRVVVRLAFLAVERVKICKWERMPADVRFVRILVRVIPVAVWEPVNICRSERIPGDVRYVGIHVAGLMNLAVVIVIPPLMAADPVAVSVEEIRAEVAQAQVPVV
jgi:hypothetical protein